ncbi:MAG: S41 family peptidase [Myxococcota bacterium]
MHHLHLVVLALVGCAWSTPAEPAPPRLDKALTAQREAIHAAETERLLATATAALERGDLVEAATAVAGGHPLAPTRFAPFVDRLLHELPASTGAELARTLDPPEAVALGRRAEARSVAERYAEREVPSPLAGVTRAHGEAVLEAARAKYVTAVDATSWLRAAHARLDLVADAWAVDVPASPDLPTLWTNAMAAGLPEPVVVGETTAAALGALDRWSRPVWPAEITAWTQQHDGVQVGIGVQIFDRDGSVVVGYPVPGSAAWDGDVLQDDVIVGIDGVRVADMPAPAIDAVVDALHGPPGSAARVTLARDAQEHTVTLTRRSVPAETVVGYVRDSDNGWSPWLDEGRSIAYVRIGALRPHSDEAFDALLHGLTPKALILDLRGNAGGDVQAALEVADRFVAEGVLAQLTGRTVRDPVPAEGEVPWNVAVPGHALEPLANARRPRIVAVIDEGTGSAAELLALMLRQHAGAVVVGAESYGKLSTQVLGSDERLPVAWQITHGQLRVPKQPPAPVVPDHEVALSPAEGVLVDVLLARREHLRSHRDGSPIRYTGPASDGTLPPLDRDPQLAMARAVLTR